jgi:hypothetical protein
VAKAGDVLDQFLQLSPNVAVVDGSELPGDETHVYLGPLPDGPIMVLEGDASAIYRAAVVASSEMALVADVARQFDLPEDVVEPGVLHFLEDLIWRGLLRRHLAGENTGRETRGGIPPAVGDECSRPPSPPLRSGGTRSGTSAHSWPTSC